MKDYRGLVSEYKKKKKLIKGRLKSFRNIHKLDDRKIFPELCFCLLTPQSNARQCDIAIRELIKKDLLFNGTGRYINPVLRGRARFHKNKANYIVNARKCFDRSILSANDIPAVRERLVKNIKGLGYKEASHFLRNIGLGKDIAILDRHILKNLKRYGVIRTIPASLTPKTYLDIENKTRLFSAKIKIPLEEMDLLFWSKETGEIFK